MNAIFQSSSQFGSPFSSFTNAGVVNEIYRTNSTNNTTERNFSNIINGATASFSFYSPSYNQISNTLTEKTPDPYAVFDFLYKNDNSGFTSPNTGFFVGFKQGTLEHKDFQISEGLPNMVLDINADNVANGNVWVQTIDELGQVRRKWTQVDRLYGNNTLFNAKNNAIRDIFSVASRENDQVSIVFGDGNFGNVPKGIIRVWYRTGLNQTYTLTPDSFNSSSFNLSYIGQNGNTFNAIFNVSLKTNVTNASVRESLRSIKSNAP